MTGRPATAPPIETEEQYEAAMVEYESYFDSEPEPSSTAAERFVLLGALLSRYEEERFPI